MDKPEALRLADWLEDQYDPTYNQEQAAAELRRLHEAHDWQYEMAGERLRRVEKLEAQRDALMRALKNVTVHLIAAHSLLQRGGKKAAASDTMFSMMLEDYEKSFEVGRAAIKAVEEGK